MNKRQKQLLCLFLGSSLLLGAPGQAAAAEAEQTEFSLDEYVITASRMPTRVSETAANVTVIGREELERRNVATISEALLQAGVNVTVEGGGAGDSSSAMLNGDNRVVILVDGRKINHEQMTDNSSTGYSLSLLPDLGSVEKIEVVRGAASSLYGSAGVGGVINIITRKGAENRTTASTEFGNWGSKKISLQTSGKSGDTGYMITAGRWIQGNYEYKDPGTGKVVAMPNSDFARKNASVRIDRELGKDRTLTFYFDHLDEYAGSPIAKPGSIYHGYEYFRPESYRQTIQNNISLSYRWQQGESINNNLQLYRNYYKLGWYNIQPGSRSVYINQADGIEWNQTRRLSSRHTLLGGFDWRNTYADDLCSRYTGNTIRNLGLFLEDRWTWDSRWALTLGMRRDDNSKYDDKSTARLSLNRKINDNTNAYLSWGQVYRAPNALDLFRPDSAAYRHNPGLKPESGHTATLGINARLAGGTTIQASLFSNYMKDAFKWNYVNDMSGNVYAEMINVAEQKKRGLDIAVTQPLNQRLNLTAGYSYLQVKEDLHNGNGYRTDISNSNPNFYRLGADFHDKAWNVNLTLRGATGRSPQAFTSGRYWVTDVGVSYQLNPDVKLYAKAYNLTNQAYETIYLFNIIGSQPMAARQIVFGMESRL